MEHPQDHDLLIRLDEKVETLIKSVATLTDDHEVRIRYLEKWFWKAWGGALVINFILLAIVAWFTNKNH